MQHNGGVERPFDALQGRDLCRHPLPGAHGRFDAGHQGLQGRAHRACCFAVNPLLYQRPGNLCIKEWATVCKLVAPQNTTICRLLRCTSCVRHWFALALWSWSEIGLRRSLYRPVHDLGYGARNPEGQGQRWFLHKFRLNALLEATNVAAIRVLITNSFLCVRPSVQAACP